MIPRGPSIAILLALLLAAAAPARAADPGSPPADGADPLALLDPLLGDWTAEGGGQPGAATGAFSFARDLQGKVVVRRNHADYPAAGKREAFAHDDLMVFQAEAERLRAHYFDSEGHHVEYSVALDGAARRLVLVSAATPGQPRFRLSYDLSQPDRTEVAFEIAPPGAPEQFRPYVSGKARRTARPR